jgi:RNA polymerase sigma-70 factor, ECF subfamily
MAHSVSLPFHQTEVQITEDQAVVELSLKDMSHFSALYEKYYENILRYVYQRVSTKEEAIDITAQVFLNAMVNLKKYSFRGLPFSAWLYRIASNELLLLFRKNKNKRCINIDEAGLHNITAELKDELEENKQKIFIAALDQLTAEDYELIQMRFFEQRSFAKVAEILGITENNAKVKTYRIIDKLKQLIVKI